jgi:hypothetical protein
MEQRLEVREDAFTHPSPALRYGDLTVVRRFRYDPALAGHFD